MQGNLWTAAMPAEAKTIDAEGLAERERVLRMFGSMARGEGGPASDVDLLADIDRESNSR